MIDSGTVTRGITYLYRWWIQKELNIVPEAYIRHGGVGILVCPEWVLVGSGEPVPTQELENIRTDLNRPVYVICPRLPAGTAGFDLTEQKAQKLPQPVGSAVQILQEKQKVLATLGEENPEREEWWKTRDVGDFKVWKGRALRLLVYPTKENIYGYSVTKGEDGGLFFFRSRSCREEGRTTRTGIYKMSEHALSSGRKVNNLDLLFSDGTVMLLRLLPTGAGFKVFPRRVAGYEGSLE